MELNFRKGKVNCGNSGSRNYAHFKKKKSHTIPHRLFTW